MNVYSVRDINETCYGEVTAIEFCYRYDILGDGEAYFNWTVLILEDEENAPKFRIVDLYSIESRPSDLGGGTCISTNSDGVERQHCCDVQMLTSPFTLGANFAFGVTESPQGNTHDAQLLGFFPASMSPYNVVTVRLTNGQGLSVGSDVNRAPTVNEGLRLLWLIIGRSIDIVYICTQHGQALCY